MGYEAGSLIQGMKEHIFGKELHEKIIEVRKEKNWDEFWLIFQQKPDRFLCNVIRNGWTATNERPPPISNTIQFYIDWKNGRIESKVFAPDAVTSNLYNYIPDNKQELDLNRKLAEPMQGHATGKGVVWG